MWAYDYSFGGWEIRSMPDKDLSWIVIFHILFTFFFSIIMVNVLIAIVSESYAQVDQNRTAYDIKEKFDTTVEGIEMDKNLFRFFRCKCFRKLSNKAKRNNMKSRYNLYHILKCDDDDQDQDMEAKIIDGVQDKVDDTKNEIIRELRKEIGELEVRMTRKMKKIVREKDSVLVQTPVGSMTNLNNMGDDNAMKSGAKLSVSYTPNALKKSPK